MEKTECGPIQESFFSFKETETGLNKENIISKTVLFVMLVTFFQVKMHFRMAHQGENTPSRVEYPI